MNKSPQSHYADLGEIGEDLVVQWLKSTGWLILQRHFYSRWGEIDIIAEHRENGSTLHFEPILAFIEVKTRSSGNWDLGGRSAITWQKQAKIRRTAEIFLFQNPQKYNYSCRFDVALVHCQRTSKTQPGVIPEVIASLSTDKYELRLQDYIPAAFDA